MAKKVKPKVWKTQKIRRQAAYLVSEPRDNLVFLDLETTGVDPAADRIIEFSAVKYSVLENGRLEERKRINEFIRPPVPISDKITEITGITNEQLQNYGYESEIFPKIKEFMESAEILLGYNILAFDAQFMAAMYERQSAPLPKAKAFDVLPFVKNMDVGELDSFALSAVCKHFGVDAGLQFHSSIDDVIATRRLFEVLTRDVITSLPPRMDLYKPDVYPHSIRYWQGPRHSMQRVYVSTSVGSLYYDFWKHGWVSNDVDLAMGELDLDYIQSVTMHCEGCNNIEDFEKTGRRKCQDSKKSVA